jgi:predicted Zn-dependent protease
MRNLILLFVMVTLIGLSACSSVPVSAEKALTIVNASGVDSSMLEQIQDFVGQQLQVPVRIVDDAALAEADRFQTLEAAAMEKRHELDVIYIVLAALDSNQHLAVFEESRIALINTDALFTDDPKKFHRRIERQIMRAAAFCVGLPPTPDPFCVTRNYKSLEDLDKMGRNFSPPWQGRFADKAEELGLLIKNKEGGPKKISAE